MELFSHNFEVKLSAQVDTILHVDQTRAVEPLELIGAGSAGDQLNFSQRELKACLTYTE